MIKEQLLRNPNLRDLLEASTSTVSSGVAYGLWLGGNETQIAAGILAGLLASGSIFTTQQLISFSKELGEEVCKHT
ncbi:hypothetical protein GYA49_03310 [Candidatus Beckwithbacteria bacterium]|nr:hypothetical protein [Candidatus Beckwithbacteria bacterium]